MDNFASSNGDFNQIDGGLEINASAPGKVILHGEHAVVYGKIAVAAALGLRTRLKIVEISQPNTIILNLLPLKYVQIFQINDIQELWSDPSIITSNISKFNLESISLLNFDPHLKNIEKILQKVLSNKDSPDSPVVSSLKCFLFLLSGMISSLEVDLSSIAVNIESELQIGAGTGSSASFSVCLAAGLLQYLKLKTANGSNNISKCEFKPFSWKTSEDDSFELNLNNLSEKQLDLVCQWSFLGEKIFHGTPSGIDNTVCCYGNMVEFRKGDKPNHIKLKNTFDILLINSHVSRNTAQLVAKVANFRSQFPVLVDKILDLIENVTLDAIKLIQNIENCQSDEEFSKDFQNLTWLSQMNHIFLMSLGVSHPKLQEIMKILEEHGLNGKLTGAGGGGFALALVPPNFDSTKVRLDLEKCGFGVICTKLGGVGVTLDVGI